MTDSIPAPVRRLALHSASNVFLLAKLDFPWPALCLVGAVYFVFRLA